MESFSNLRVRYEKWFGKKAFLHLSVSKAMLHFLDEDWLLKGQKAVLYDKAPVHFRRLSEFERSHV
jgi:beta-1,4-mannosyltransferase